MLKSKRDRGRILTAPGLKKLNEALQEWSDRYNIRGTLTEIEAESGVGADTVSKIKQGREGADLSKIRQLFAAFELTLTNGDHRSAKLDDAEDVGESDNLPAAFDTANNSRSVKVFVSYRSAEPDRELGKQLETALSAIGHTVFTAENNIRLGDNWFDRINYFLKECDYLLLLLPPTVSQSELLTYQVQQAKELQDSRPDKKPIILPIRVGFPLNVPLNHDLRGYLYRIEQREWQNGADTPILIEEVLKLLAETPAPVKQQPEDLTPNQVLEISSDEIPQPSAEPELPGGQVDVASQFYVERQPIEERCYQTILQPSALIRIKAPRQMGKTSLMAKILHHGSRQGYCTVPLTFQLVDKSVFANLDKFLKWFCAYVGRELHLANQLDDYWDDIFGSKVNCKDYFEKYILPQIDSPLILGLDEIDRVFQYPDIAEDFLGLLRAWHEESKRRDIWKKLRLIVVHSTEVYIPMNINQSPFNVGLPVDLPEFNAGQIQDLAARHNLSWSDAEVEQLMATVGGHPYLVRVALYHISRSDLTLNQLKETAASDAGIYSDHLRRQLWNLEEYPELAQGMREIAAADSPVPLKAMQAFKLDSLGLVKLQGNECVPRCELYRQYFRSHLGNTSSLP
ncbi:MAG: AAA-like domain-containing protein [Microcoleus sp. PH2017_22_RUC_O_B]|uniref:AAA-like domain-containing protein n=1 Tax=unclassified Microcoleus TaxID=2642155 RepID=UPI001DF61424|nr:MULTISPECIES: AAA-like domain-containing protein [unclassified Microcoleus]MCC3531313.1 AAA-like domain-containing protein [Microcoleus sp. PH2017_21_RUC_O_A]MCC3543590.1 AAA-like domain-containing protein [Microcoleus sp. PH2017_22_RUC_O_B]